MEQQWYKVTDADGRGPYTGWLWPLPEPGSPGAWTPLEADVRLGWFGYHLTLDPIREWRLGRRIWFAEGRGEQDPLEPSPKLMMAAFAQARLLREVPLPAWLAAGVDVYHAVSAMASAHLRLPDDQPDKDEKYRVMLAEEFADAAIRAAGRLAPMIDLLRRLAELRLTYVEQLYAGAALHLALASDLEPSPVERDGAAAVSQSESMTAEEIARWWAMRGVDLRIADPFAGGRP